MARPAAISVSASASHAQHPEQLFLRAEVDVSVPRAQRAAEQRGGITHDSNPASAEGLVTGEGAIRGTETASISASASLAVVGNSQLIAERLQQAHEPADPGVPIVAPKTRNDGTGSRDAEQRERRDEHREEPERYRERGDDAGGTAQLLRARCIRGVIATSANARVSFSSATGQ
ncbi:MAG: hypothetical protein U0610_07430 [bacterium]